MKKLFIIIFLNLIQVCFSQNLKIEFFQKQKKFGLVKDSKILVIPKYDSIRLKKAANSMLNNHYEAYYNRHIDIFDVNGKKIISNILAIESLLNFSSENIQVIDSLNQTYFIDSLGQKLDINNFKSFFTHPELLDNKLNYDAIVTYKIVLSNKINVESFYYNLNNYKNAKPEYQNILSPKNSVFIKFIYNNDISISFPKERKTTNSYKDHEYNNPFSQYQIIIKKNNKFGVWNLKTKKMDIPLAYDEINVYEKNLILKADNLYTSFPNIGKKTKYKKLEPYIEYFARFETSDGKKGWVDRKGKEYFDN